MCGFAAVVALNGHAANPTVARRMSEVLRHRGPDDSGHYAAGPVAFSFRRLSILDLTHAGHQPMLSDDGRVVIVFNGEIFNYIELRGELESLGHTFRSRSDTEVLVHAYLQWGADCLPHLNGMWSFLIHDQRSGAIFGSRDRFGVKPLYRYIGRDHVLFGSEIKAIRASGLYRDIGEVNWVRAAQFFSAGRLDLLEDSTDTFYPAIEQVPAGSAFELYPDGRQREWRYWSAEAKWAANDVQVADAPRAFYELFEDSVRLRTRSDVPVGVTLSGGLDSTSIISAMAQLRASEHSAAGTNSDAGLHAFSYVSRDFDETAYIAETVTQTRAQLHVVEIDPQRLWQNLDTVLWHQDEPVHSLPALIGYELYGLARAHGVKVVLCGQGADEYLAGYPVFFGSYWQVLLRAGQVRRAYAEIKAYAQGGATSANKHFQKAITRLIRSQLGRVPGYGVLRQLRRHTPTAASRWFTRDFIAKCPQASEPPANETLSVLLRRAFESSPLPLYLRTEDRNSMAHSVEARLPFLDPRLVLLLSQLPDRWKLSGSSTKHVLREAMRNRIPEIVRTRSDKMGFPAPGRKWFAGALYEPMQDLLASEAVRTRGIYNVPAIRQDLERHRAGDLDVSHALFNVAQWESWLTLAREPEPAEPRVTATAVAR